MRGNTQSPRVVVVWSPPRVASTWLCHTLRFGMELAGLRVELVFWGDIHRHVQARDVNAIPDVIVIKTHTEATPESIAELRRRCDVTLFTLVRPALGILQSFRRVASQGQEFVLTTTTTVSKRILDAAESGEQFHVIHEADARDGLINLYRDVFSYAEIPLTDEQLSLIQSECSLESNARTVTELSDKLGLEGFSDYDPASQWHGNHINLNGYDAEVLDRDVQVQLILLDSLSARIAAHSAATQAPHTPPRGSRTNWPHAVFDFIAANP